MQNSKLQFKIKNFRIIILFSIFYFLFSSPAFAAILYLEPSTGEYHQGDIFLVDIRLDTQGEIVNAVEVNLSFDKEILEFKDFSKGNSILTLWIEELSGSYPNRFSGGVPGGYWGANGLLGKIVFQAQEPGNAQIIFQDNSRVLLNDGKGTEAELITKGAVFTILAEKLEVPKDEWKEKVEEDNILPEPFKIEISQDPVIFEGKYFIVFSTTDKQTGIDHYEVKEGDGKWQVTSSPYVLKNQKLTDDIWVKAVDKAGNEWIEIVKASRRPVWIDTLYLVLVLIKIIIIIRAIWWTIKNVKRKTKNAK